MTFAKLNWKMKEQTEKELVDQLENQLSYSKAFIQLCVQRGLHTVEEIEEFVHPQPTLFHDPFLLFQMEKAVERIEQAIENEECILIFGDYDADGITSTTILKETLEMIGASVVYYLPNRFTDGYGPNSAVFKRYIEEENVRLIITVDCGIAAREAVSFAMQQEVDVIVTDHHEIPEQLPDAYAIIHPKHPEGTYPFSDLSGAGVALKVASALLGEPPLEMLELAAIGTIADLVNVTDENRTIVKQGLRLMKETARVGLSRLFSYLKINREDIDETTIGFLIGPRLNALGRLGDATPGVELLSTFEEDTADEIIRHMVETNEKRQQLVTKIVEEALEQVEQSDALVHVVWNENWHEGVLGIVASRIVEETGRPTFVLTKTKEGLLKGSARSIEAFHIFEACQELKELLEKFGGHHMAAGLTIQQQHIESFTEKINQLASHYREEIEKGNSIDIALEVPLATITREWIEELALLKPFGTGNPLPYMMIRNVQVTSNRMLGNKNQHLKIEVGQQEHRMQAIAFNKGSWSEKLPVGATISIVGTVENNEWNGRVFPQMMLNDISPEQRLFFDWRSSALRMEHLNVLNALYLVSHPKWKSQIEQKLDARSRVVLWSEVEETMFTHTTHTACVIVDCPTNKEEVERVLSYDNPLDTYVIAVAREQVMLLGMPTREQFTRVYRYIATHQPIKKEENWKNVAKKLNLPEKQFKFILHVFFEAKFVTIEKDLIHIQQAAQSVQLENLPLMKKRKEQMWLEKVFVYSKFSDLASWLNQQHGGKE